MQFRVIGMDCARDAADIERSAALVLGAGSARVSVASHILTVRRDMNAGDVAELEAAVTRLGYRLAPVAPHSRAVTPQSSPTSGHHTPAYRRALWTVVVLNTGYGLIEMIGGFLAESQALKADALDFLGDGLITMLAVLAVAWSLAWRARAALLQGCFLGALGLGVLVSTGYRVLVQQQPVAEVMGVLAAVALIINLSAAAVLVPHRTGDAHVRAVWLFSRNDAIGNMAVLIAAGLVALTATPWPDLLVAVVIAVLFLHSAASIIADARRDLGEGVTPT